MNSQSFLLLEFMMRKNHILNLEMRLFIITLILEVSFFIFYIYFRKKLLKEKILSLLSLSIFSFIFFKAITVVGKMGLVSQYLRQFENYISSIGYQGIIWESKALDNIIFTIGNAFTLPATIALLIILCQTIYAYWFTFSLYIKNKKLKIFIILLLSMLIVFIALKSFTVDFYKEIPNIF